MTIEEIKSVSIVQFLESQGYHHVYILKENYWYLSPFRTEASPSFNVSPKKNLWNDFGAGEGGNLINLVQKMNPSWNNHEVLTYLEQKIKEHHLQYSEDYEAQRKENERKEAWKQDQAAQREKAKEANTIIERIVGLSHPYLRDYILQRRIDYDIAKEYCKEKGKDLKIEIEVRNFDELQQVLDLGGVDRIMFDNFTPAMTKKAVEMVGGRYETESSGGITFDTLRDYAECGVDFISVGALTHSVKGLDMSFKAC